MFDLNLLDTERDRDGFITLKRSYSNLYKKTMYIAPLTVVYNRVYEYDIKSAGFTMLQRAGVLSRKTIKVLESTDKKTRNVTIGNMIKRDKKLQTIINNGILEAREMLFRENGIQDIDVQAIRKDAIFIIGRKLRVTQFGEFIEFRLKGQYSMYMKIDKIEFYYDRRSNRVDVKGISDDVIEEPDHQEGMIEFFRQVFRFLVMDQRDRLRQYLIQFAHDYKSFNLPHQYYRELSRENIYRTKMEISGFDYNLTQAGDSDFDIINPVYNYRRFVLPIIQMYI